MLDIMTRDPIWEMMDWFSNPFERKISESGFRNVIKRPHSLINVKDENGDVIAQRLEVTTTPFKKDDVKVKISNNMLIVTCGSENIKDAENEEVVYRGISSQSYSFSLSLGKNVDQKKITAVNKDGILKVTLPLIIEKPEEPETIEVEID